MKYLIILIIIGLVLWGLISLLNIRISTNPNDINEDIHRTSAIEYLSKFKEGILLPKSKIFVWTASRNFSFRNGRNICEENSFMLSKITEEEFFQFINQLGLGKKPNLLEFWPDAFFYEGVNDAVHEWNVTKITNEYTYYGENPDFQIELAARYENNKVFIRTKAKVEIITDDDGKWIKTKVLNRR